jgi:hypothetical protein
MTEMGIDRFPWCAPGDDQQDAWIVRFNDTDMREAIFRGPDAERDARAKWEMMCGPSGTWNGYLFRLSTRTPATEMGIEPLVESGRDAQPRWGRAIVNDELLRLAERVEAATGPERELDAEIGYIADWSKPGHDRIRYLRDTARNSFADIGRFTEVPDYTASLDAAMSLVPEGWTLAQLLRSDDRNHWSALMWGMDPWTDLRPNAPSARAATPALALCAASLRSRAHPLEGE